MKDLMIKNNLSIKAMMLIASLDNLSVNEMNDLEYVQDRIDIHVEDNKDYFTSL